MRIAVVSDIHGNLTAFLAVQADLRETAPDLVFHGGDLAAPGSSPCEIVDRIRDLGWSGVVGNADEMLARQESLSAFAAQSKAPRSMWDAIQEMADAAKQVLGQDRLDWLAALPLVQRHELFALVHASPGDCWRSPGAEASDEELERTYSPLGSPVAVFGHIHVPFVRRTQAITVANSGSVGQPYDGDRRASYLLVDESGSSIRRVEYEVDREIRRLRECGLPYAEWSIKMLTSARPAMP